MGRLTKAQTDTLAKMDLDTGYSSAAMGHRLYRSIQNQRRVMLALHRSGFVALEPDYSGDMWSITEAGLRALTDTGSGAKP